MGVYTQNLCRDGCVYAGLVLVWGRMYVGHYVRIGMKVYTRGLCMYGGGCVRRACVAMEMVRTWGLCGYGDASTTVPFHHIVRAGDGV